MPHRRRVPALTAHRTGPAAAAVLLAACAATGCGATGPAASSAAATFSDGGVDVTLVWRSRGPALAIVATFAPQRAGYHLYSGDLPPDGVDGVGRPTRVEAGPGTLLTGPPVADRAPSDLVVPGVDGPLPVYPAGPVTLTVPVRLTADGAPGVLVTYAACSATACLPPVVRHAVRLTAPPP